MYQKLNDLSTDRGILGETYLIERNEGGKFFMARGEKTRGEKMKVSPIMLLKKRVEKMSVFGLAIMLLKTNKLWSPCPYVDENK
jgi:hypothetical protein